MNFLGAIQDALTGFPVTAGARILEAFLGDRRQSWPESAADSGSPTWSASTWVRLNPGVYSTSPTPR